LSGRIYGVFIVALGLTYGGAQARAMGDFWSRAQVLSFNEVHYAFGTHYEKNKTESLTQGSQRYLSVSWEVLTAATNGDIQRQLQTYAEKEGIRKKTSAAKMYWESKKEAVSLKPAVSYGLTSRWSVGLRGAVRINSTKNQYKLVPQKNLEKALNNGAELPGEVSEQILQKKIKSNRFHSVEGRQEKAQIGDVDVLSKYLIYSDVNSEIAMKNQLTFPGGVHSSPYSLSRQKDNSGQFDIGLGLVGDHFMAKKWRLLSAMSYRFQMKDDVALRVPGPESSMDQPSIDENVSRDLGDVLESSLGAAYQLAQGVWLESGMTYWRKDKDRYSGSKFSAVRYEKLSENTEAQAGILNLGLALAPKMNGFKKTMATLNVHRVTFGRNLGQTTASLILDFVY